MLTNRTLLKMKTFICYSLFILSLLFSSSALSQDLTGVWQGYHTYNLSLGLRADTVRMALSITANTNGGYDIVSYTKLPMLENPDTVLICKVLYKKTGKRSIRLTETKFPHEEIGYEGYQEMYLRIRQRHGRMRLIGYWANVQSKGMQGQMFFEKRN